MIRAALQFRSMEHKVDAFGRIESVPNTQTGRFLATLDEIMPWSALNEIVRPLFVAELMVQVDYSLETLMRAYFLQRWFGLSDSGVADGVADSLAMAAFVRLGAKQPASGLADAVARFRDLLECHRLSGKLERLSEACLGGNRYTVIPGTSRSPSLQVLVPLDNKLQVLANFFAAIDKPYGLSEIFRFNAIYRELYPDLSQAERIQAELYVDKLIDGVEEPAYAARIYGVV
ncbi:MAG: transposase [Methylococcaceae bacterium]|nr:transposase [Methylococcaceae bacterium]